MNQPAKAIRIPAVVQPLERHNERLLGGVLGIFMAPDDREGHRIRGSPVTGDELPEGPFVAISCLPNQDPRRPSRPDSPMETPQASTMLKLDHLRARGRDRTSSTYRSPGRRRNRGRSASRCTGVAISSNLARWGRSHLLHPLHHRPHLAPVPAPGSRRPPPPSPASQCIELLAVRLQGPVHFDLEARPTAPPASPENPSVSPFWRATSSTRPRSAIIMPPPACPWPARPPGPWAWTPEAPSRATSPTRTTSATCPSSTSRSGLETGTTAPASDRTYRRAGTLATRGRSRTCTPWRKPFDPRRKGAGGGAGPRSPGGSRGRKKGGPPPAPGNGDRGSGPATCGRRVPQPAALQRP